MAAESNCKEAEGVWKGAEASDMLGELSGTTLEMEGSSKEASPGESLEDASKESPEESTEESLEGSSEESPGSSEGLSASGVG